MAETRRRRLFVVCGGVVVLMAGVVIACTLTFKFKKYEDSEVKESDPGGFVLYNENDSLDDDEVADYENDVVDRTEPTAECADPDLVCMFLNAEGSSSGTVILELLSGEKKVKVWQEPERTDLLLYDKDTKVAWAPGQMPKNVHVEGYGVSELLRDVRLKATWTGSGGMTPPLPDDIYITVVKLDLDVDTDNDNGYGDPDRSTEEDVNENDADDEDDYDVGSGSSSTPTTATTTASSTGPTVTTATAPRTTMTT